MKGLLGSIILLPGTVIVVVPLVLLYLSTVFFHEKITISGNILLLIFSFLFFALGCFLMATTICLFVRIGKGTPAPWNPPTHLVIAGPYRYVRNPMISSLLFILLAETVFIWSLVLLIWTSFFFLANLVYLPFIEEKKMRKRFGSEYEEYEAMVPRWIPRTTPWEEK